MPEVGEYTLIAQVTDGRGIVVTDSITVGRTVENWNLHPLSGFDAFNVRMDKSVSSSQQGKVLVF